MSCKRCGSELDSGARFCPACGALQPMICPHCGAESRPGSRDCSSCGKKLPMADREDKLVYVPRKKHTGAVIATIIGVLCALLLLCGAVMLLMDNLNFNKQEEQTFPEEIPTISIQPEVQKPVEEVPVVEAPPAAEEPVKEEEPAVEEEAPVEDETPAEEEAPVEEEAPAEEEEPVKEEEPKEETKPSMDGEWIFADSSERLLTDADIAGMSSWELKLARNEIYARHGRRFNSDQLQNYFDSRTWYKGTIAPGDFLDTMLNPTELANVQFLKAAE